MYMRNRTTEEKIEDCLDNKIKNLHPKFREELYQLLLNTPDISNNVAKSKQFVCNLYEFPEQGMFTKQYWLSRGWSEGESNYKSKQSNTRKKTPSPFSREYWLEKINPETNSKYTELEADYKRNSQRPIRKEYWIKQGYSEEESVKLAIQQKDANNKSGAKSSGSRGKEFHRISSPRCKEYYMLRGFTEEESIDKVCDVQSTFSLDICVEKYGMEEGTRLWQARQDNWQATLNSKSEEEKAAINRGKATKINYRTLWDKELDTPGILYLLKVYKDDEIFYKIGITTRTVRQRYNGYTIGGYVYEVIRTVNDTIHKCFLMEQDIIKSNKSIRYSPNEKFEGWTECFINEPVI
jgi:hypothetical protein